MGNTKINWTEKVWNPVTGCNKGCEFCYARKFAKRLQNNPNFKIAHKYRNGFWPTFHEEELKTPLTWKQPRIVFVPSMGDMFDPEFKFHQHCQIFEAMSVAWRHIYLILTKYPENLQAFLDKVGEWDPEYYFNMWFGVSVTTQKQAEEYIPLLINTKHTNLFISVEPLLEKIDLSDLLSSGKIKWVIAGGITGREAGKEAIYNIWNLADQCRKSKVPVYIKSYGTGNNAAQSGCQQYPEFQFNDDNNE
jgi:protein gp37